MNQIQAPAYQQPSFGPARGIYPQQPLYARAASSSSSANTPHPLSFSTSQSQLDSTQALQPQATSPPPSQASLAQQPVAGHGGFTGADGNFAASPSGPFPGQIAQSQLNNPAPSPSQQRYPMAAPPLPASVQRQQSPTSNAGSSQPASPTSSAKSVLERKRVAILLDINLVLLEDLNRLQAEGKGGAVSAQQAQLLRNQGLPDNRSSDEYTQTFYRLQANLAYLYSQPDMQALNPQRQDQPQQSNKGPTHPPNFMHAPPHMPALEDKYGALRQLFPGWAGKDAAISPGGSAAAAAAAAAAAPSSGM